MGGSDDSPQGQRHWWQQFWGVLISIRPPEGCHFLKDLAPPKSLEAPDLGGFRQITNSRNRTQPQTSADRLPKVFLSPQVPAKHIQNLCDPAKAVRSGKFTAIQSQLKKQKNLNLTLHLKQQEPKKKKI